MYQSFRLLCILFASLYVQYHVCPQALLYYSKAMLARGIYYNACTGGRPYTCMHPGCCMHARLEFIEGFYSVLIGLRQSQRS